VLILSNTSGPSFLASSDPYFAAMRSARLHRGEPLVEAKVLHQNSFQGSGHSCIQTLFLQKPWRSLRNLKDVSEDLAGSATKAIIKESVTPASSDSIVFLTMGVVIKIPFISMMSLTF
jgi:hypothetical protein